MFSYVKGSIAEILEGTLTVETGGVGYELAASTQTLSTLRVGDEVKIFTYMAVREDGVSLYGFTSKQEKNMFLRLIGVSGVGAKVAMAVLSGMTAQRLAAAVAAQDTAALASVKGIGKKTAERIVLELKDKVAQELTAQGDCFAPLTAQSGVAAEAVLALVSLGYSKSEAAAAVARVKDADTLKAEQIILLALKN
ncbi:MAG: Holliday junction branch migration protein RuvA [Firmicutes bacterium]|nr:Holliday junction branch migration protein RuvA [Bacillota bacterium]